MMKKLALLLILLLSAASFAQTAPLHFAATIYGIEDPPAAFTLGIFNPATSGKTIYIDVYRFSAGFESTDTTGYVEVGTSVATSLPVGGTCTNYPILNMDFTDPGQQVKRGSTTLSVAKIIGQPCTGSIDTNNLGSNLPTAALNKYSPSFISTTQIVLPPGKGYVIYLGQTFHGTWIGGFEWHEQ